MFSQFSHLFNMFFVIFLSLIIFIILPAQMDLNGPCRDDLGIFIDSHNYTLVANIDTRTIMGTIYFYCNHCRNKVPPLYAATGNIIDDHREQRFSADKLVSQAKKNLCVNIITTVYHVLMYVCLLLNQHFVYSTVHLLFVPFTLVNCFPPQIALDHLAVPSVCYTYPQFFKHLSNRDVVLQGKCQNLCYPNLTLLNHYPSPKPFSINNRINPHSSFIKLRAFNYKNQVCQSQSARVLIVDISTAVHLRWRLT